MAEMLRTKTEPLDVRALILGLDRALATVPLSPSDVSQRSTAVKQLLGLIEECGLDGESLLRQGMAPRVALPLLIALVGETAIAISDLDRWREVLGLYARGDASDATGIAARLSTIFPAIEAWVAHAPLDEVLGFRPPDEQRLSDYAIEHRLREPDVAVPYSWLWHRSARDDLDSWPTPLLHAEYRWRNGLERAPFSEQVISHEGPDIAVLNEQIAFRAASGSDEQPDPADSLFWQMQDTAVDFLRRKRYNEAAALFEFHCRRNPDDARGLNNLGFCKVPTEPAAALDLTGSADCC